ncbi:MAG: T9SS type A sorting domain-containing protein, partial [Bacteroidota bacterium]
ISKLLVPDTVFPATLDLDCASQATAFFSDTSGTLGYLFGSNQFGDVEKLQRITLSETQSFEVTDVFVAFAVADEEVLDRKIVVNIYSDLNESGSIAPLGASDSIAVRDLSIGEGSAFFTQFPFSNPVQITDASSFLVSVDVADVYNASTGNIGIFHTEPDCGSGENALEIFPTDMGFGFNTILANWNLNAEMFVGAIIDVEGDPTSTRNLSADYQVQLSPNPTDDKVQLNFTSDAAKITTRLFSTSGQLLREQVVPTVAGSGQVDWDLSDLPSGLYLYRLEGPAGVQSGKVMVR